MPACAPDATQAGQGGDRKAGSGSKTGLEDAPRATIAGNVRLPRDANSALCSPSLAGCCPKTK